MLTKVIGGEPITYRAVNTDHDESGPSLPVTIEQAPEETGDRVWVLDAIQYSYSAPVTTGGITVKLDEKVKFDIDTIEQTGSFSLYIPSQTDKVISVTLKAGGNGVIGKLNCQWHLEPAL
jgi:hypothetical protein